jgi:hypothetical protein
MSEGSEKDLASRKSPWNMTTGLLIGLAVGVVLGLIQGDLLDGLGFGLVIGLALGVGFERRDQMMQFPPGVLRRVILAAGLFLIALLGSKWLLDFGWEGPLQIVITLAPALAFLLLVLAVGAAIASLDELQRRIQTEAISIGFGFTALAAITYGLLGELGMPQPNWIYLILPMSVGWVVGKLWTMWKYR